MKQARHFLSSCCILLLGSWAVSAAPYDASIRWNQVQIFSQPNLNSEVLGRVSRGDQVTVLEDFVAPASTEQPMAVRWSRVAWRRGALPTPPRASTAPVAGIRPQRWVSAQFVDITRQQITVPKLNVRSGPSENFPVVEQLSEGDRIQILERSGNWLGLAPKGGVAPTIPPTAGDPLPGTQTHGYLQSQYLAPIYEPPSVQPEFGPVTSSPAQTRAIVPSPPQPFTSAGVGNVGPANPTESRQQPAQTTRGSVPAPESLSTRTSQTNPGSVVVHSRQSQAQPQPIPRSSPPTQTVIQTLPPRLTTPIQRVQPRIPSSATVVSPPPQPEIRYTDDGPRIVTRDGVVRRAFEPKSPAHFELRSHRGEGLISFLVPSDPDMKLTPWVGQRVLVTGEESIDRAWRRYPIIVISEIRPTF
jgi:hypothetical protein